MDYMDFKFLEHWMDCKVTEIMEITGCKPETAESVVHELLTSRKIPQGYPLLFEDFGYVTVPAALSDPARYDQRHLYDPAEYRLFPGHFEAIFDWGDGVPAIRTKNGTEYEFAGTSPDSSLCETSSSGAD